MTEPTAVRAFIGRLRRVLWRPRTLVFLILLGPPMLVLLLVLSQVRWHSRPYPDHPNQVWIELVDIHEPDPRLEEPSFGPTVTLLEGGKGVLLKYRGKQNEERKGIFDLSSRTLRSIPPEPSQSMGLVMALSSGRSAGQIPIAKVVETYRGQELRMLGTSPQRSWPYAVRSKSGFPYFQPRLEGFDLEFKIYRTFCGRVDFEIIRGDQRISVAHHYVWGVSDPVFDFRDYRPPVLLSNHDASVVGVWVPETGKLCLIFAEKG